MALHRPRQRFEIAVNVGNGANLHSAVGYEPEASGGERQPEAKSAAPDA
jgi:hypothetical protein